MNKSGTSSSCYLCKIAFLFLLILSTGSVKAEQPLRCSQIFYNSGELVVGAKFDIHPENILQKLIRSGLKISELRLVLSFGEAAEVNIFYKKENIGGGTLEYYENEIVPGKIFINYIELKEEFVGRGIGILAYLALSKAAYLEGRILQSSYDLSSESTAVWEKLTRSGIAQKIEGEGYEFRLTTLRALEFQSSVDYLLDHFKLKKNESVSNSGEKIYVIQSLSDLKSQQSNITLPSQNK